MMSTNCLPEALDHASNCCHFLSPCTRGTIPLAVIGQLPPCVSKWDPHDTSLVTCRVATCQVMGLPPDGYALINHHKVAKDIWDKVKLLIQGTSLSKQEYSVLVVPSFLPGDDPIACVNKAMAFLSVVFTPRYPSTNNQLRSSSNPRNQATVQDGRVTVQQVQGRQGYNVAGSGSQGNASGSWGNTSCQVKPKRRRDATWFKEKVLLVQVHAEGKDLDEEQLAFLADSGVAAKAVLMANLSSCDSDVLSETGNVVKFNKKQFLIENDRLLDKIISQEIVNIVLNSSVNICDSEKKNENSVDTCNKCLELEVELIKKTDVYIELSKRKLKGKTVIDTLVSKPHATTIALGIFKTDLEPLAPKVLKNKDAHLEYTKHSREHAYILRKIVKSARALSPLDSNLDSAFAVTPKNKDKKARFADPVTPSSNTQKHVDSHKPNNSKQPLLHSTRVIGSTGASGSKPTSNTKNNRISQSSSSNKTNKVKDQSRSVKSRKNIKNRVSKTECNDYIMQSVLNVNSKSIYDICNECLFDANHDKCVLDYVHDVNVLSKSKPAKRKNKKQIWKPTGSLEVILSSKEIKFKCLQSLESKIKKKEKTQGWKRPKYGYSKNHMKTVKNGQTRTRERKSTKEAGNSKPKSKSQPSVNSQNTWQMKKAQGMSNLALKSLREQAQTSHQWIASLAIRVSDHMIQGP
ncbi:hypothetical protein Tco_0679924 [Tanacetum coccineum]|uniref:Uncharacterized protein n=1 Tax=Tanacetum coccineum TaxID=301880 RepID=A0ABQ4XJY5_9ASTR